MGTFYFQRGSRYIDLDEGSKTGVGFQATAMGGLGLPPVDVKFYELNEGAAYHYTRVLPRDFDFVVDINGSDRADLEARLSLLATLTAEPFTLGMIPDNSVSWKTTVARVGGGEISMGNDGVGAHDLQMALTVRAGDPYWTRVTSQTYTTSTNGYMTTWNNEGDVSAFPVWTFTGPMSFSQLLMNTNGTLRQFVYNAALLTGERLVVDMAAATVTKYTTSNVASNGLANVSTTGFWAIPPGLNGSSTGAQYVARGNSTGTASATWFPRRSVVI